MHAEKHDDYQVPGSHEMCELVHALQAWCYGAEELDSEVLGSESFYANSGLQFNYTHGHVQNGRCIVQGMTCQSRTLI